MALSEVKIFYKISQGNMSPYPLLLAPRAFGTHIDIFPGSMAGMIFKLSSDKGISDVEGPRN